MERPPRRPSALLLLLPLGLSALTSLRVLDAPFLLDDVRAIERAEGLRRLPEQLARLAPPGLWLGGGRPVVDVSFALGYALHGEAPRGFHLVNVALHLLTAALAFFLLRGLLRRAGWRAPDGPALAAAGLFALHPLQTEAVSYLSQRAEVLASACYLAALLALLAAERPGRTGRLAWAGSIVAFALGLGSKLVILTLPAAFLLLGLAAAPATPGSPGALPTWRRRLVLVAPHLALGAWSAASLLAGLAGHADAGFSIPGLPAGAYLVTQARVILGYLRLLTWPAGQRLEWEVPLARTLDGPTAAAWAGVLAVAALGGWLLWRGRRAADALASRAGQDSAAARVAGLGLLWFLLLLAPTSSVVPLADLMVEHRTYLASLGVLMAAVAVTARLLARAAPSLAPRLAVVLTLAAWSGLALASWQRNAAWESPLALFTNAVAKSPGHARAHFGLAVARHERGDLAGAIDEYRAALALAVGDPGKARQVSRNLGIALLAAGRFDEAAAALQQAAALDPGDARLAGLLAQVAWRQGDMARAEAQAERALALQPGAADALLTAGVARLRRGDVEGGLARLEAAARAAPDDATIRLNLGAALEVSGQGAAACRAYGAAQGLARDPGLRDEARRRLAARECPPPAP